MAKPEYGLTLEGLGVQQPYSMQAEQSVLGAAVLDPTCIDTIVQTLRPEMFFVRQNRAVYTEIMTMITNSEPVDIVILADRLAADSAFPSVAEAKGYLAELADTVPSLSNLPHYVNLVYEKYIKRLLMEQAREILEQASDDVESKIMLESAEQKLYEIRSGRDTSNTQQLKYAILDIMSHLQRLAGPNRKDYMGIPTGYSYLDHKLTGLGRSDLIILAARPGMGKTSFALNIATNVAKQGTPVIIFSLEMTKDQLAGRILSAEAAIDSHLFRTGIEKDSDWEDLTRVSEVIGPLPMYLDDTSSITIPEMKSKIRRINRTAAAAGQKPVGLVVIDYLQLMSSGKRNENRVQEISEITRNLKIMAKDLNVPVISLSQLSRSTEKGRADHRPMLSDLRDSGSIEQDADVVLFLFRESYYNNDEPETDMEVAQCIIAKNRHGETATVDMIWDGAHTRFLEMDRSSRD
ncbi:replicative DNA helicase [Ruminococcaceae bacterium OttesenSCG-928-A16]|nr:replicative DNA helicase [Ruminococcaceae bacterium OttesenSCG-928-A16]